MVGDLPCSKSVSSVLIKCHCEVCNAEGPQFCRHWPITDQWCVVESVKGEMAVFPQVII